MDLPMVEALLTPRRRDELPEWRSGDAWLAGGSWLFSEAQPDVRRLVDLRSLDWPPITVSADGVTISATCTLAQLNSYSFPDNWPAARMVRPCCESMLASFKIWTAATVGGNICLALPAGAMTALFAGLDARATVWTHNGDTRQTPVARLVTGNRTTSLRPGDVLRSIHVSADVLGQRAAIRQQTLATYGRSAALLVGRSGPNGLCLTVTAATTCPVVMHFAGSPSDAELDQTIEATVAGRWHDDVHGHPRWRRAQTHLLARELRDELR